MSGPPLKEDITGTMENVLIKEVSSFQRVKCTLYVNKSQHLLIFGHRRSVNEERERERQETDRERGGGREGEREREIECISL